MRKLGLLAWIFRRDLIILISEKCKIVFIKYFVILTLILISVIFTPDSSDISCLAEQ